MVEKVFPNSTVILPRSMAEEHAISILRALANIVKLNKGKRVNREKLWKEMLDATTEGVLVVGRLTDAGRKS